jgi:alpha-ketoglutarate-dependent taurine dioxygenase
MTAADLVHVAPIDSRWPDGPAILAPRVDDVDPLRWLQSARDWLDAQLASRGVLLLRGLSPPTVQQFRALVTSHEGALVDDNGELPRLGLGDGLYSAVDYPPGEYILWHNENSFYRESPARLWFLCLEAAEEGGATPTVDGRRMLERVDADIVDALRRRGLSYVRTYGDGLGLDWREVFRTDDRARVEARCRELGLQCDWSGDRLQTTSRRPALLRHPVTGEECWFNQITHWHPACLPPQTRGALARMDDLRPRHVTFGDGEEIPSETVAAIYKAYADLEVATPWRVGDILIVDNVLASHARRPYVGTRRLAIAMAGRIGDPEARLA